MEQQTRRCPVCDSASLEDDGDFDRCRACGWRGVVYDCHPRADGAAPAEAAGLADASCAHHPGKKAVAICAGSGDYICSLCRVELHGREYSVQYLDSGGRDLADRAFMPSLPRPDRMVCLMLIASSLFFLFFPFGAAAGTYYLYRHVRLSRKDDMYRAVRMRVWPWLCWLLMAAATAALAGAFLFGMVLYKEAQT